MGHDRRGQAELPRAASRLGEVEADGEQERTVHNIVMIQKGDIRSMKHHHLHADVETDPAQPPPSTSTKVAGLAPRHGDTDEGWKKLERKRKEKERREGKDLEERWERERACQPVEREGWGRGVAEVEELLQFLSIPSLMVSPGKREE